MQGEGAFLYGWTSPQASEQVGAEKLERPSLELRPSQPLEGMETLVLAAIGRATRAQRISDLFHRSLGITVAYACFISIVPAVLRSLRIQLLDSDALRDKSAHAELMSRTTCLYRLHSPGDSISIASRSFTSRCDATSPVLDHLHLSSAGIAIIVHHAARDLAGCGRSAR